MLEGKKSNNFHSFCTSSSLFFLLSCSSHSFLSNHFLPFFLLSFLLPSCLRSLCTHTETVHGHVLWEYLQEGLRKVPEEELGTMGTGVSDQKPVHVTRSRIPNTCDTSDSSSLVPVSISHQVPYTLRPRSWIQMFPAIVRGSTLCESMISYSCHGILRLCPSISRRSTSNNDFAFCLSLSLFQSLCQW